MPCLADVIFVDLLSVLIFICHFVKTIFTGQAGLLSFPREKKKRSWGRLTERPAEMMLLGLTVSLSAPRRWAGAARGWTCRPDRVLAFPVAYADTAPPEDATITSAEVEKHSFPPDLVVRIGLPEEWAHPRFPSSAVLGELVSLATVPEDGRPRDPPQAMSMNNPFPRGQRAGGSTCPSSAPVP